MTALQGMDNKGHDKATAQCTQRQLGFTTHDTKDRPTHQFQNTIGHTHHYHQTNSQFSDRHDRAQLLIIFRRTLTNRPYHFQTDTIGQTYSPFSNRHYQTELHHFQADVSRRTCSPFLDTARRTYTLFSDRHYQTEWTYSRFSDTSNRSYSPFSDRHYQTDIPTIVKQDSNRQTYSLSSDRHYQAVILTIF